MRQLTKLQPVSISISSQYNYFHFIFQLYITDVTAQLSNITSCIGDNIRMNCTVESFAHTWDFGPLSEVTITSGTGQDQVQMGFTFRLVEISNTSIVSLVTGTVIPELNNTVILCRDGLRPIGQGDKHQVTATVLGECTK